MRDAAKAASLILLRFDQTNLQFAGSDVAEEVSEVISATS